MREDDVHGHQHPAGGQAGLLRYFRTPQLVVLGTIQGALFLLIFRYVFGGAMSIHGTSYVNFLVPGFVTTGVLFTGQGAATGVAEDLQQGFVDRLKSLPVPRACFLAGRAIADSVWTTWGLLVAIAVGLGVGFRPDGSAAGDLAALGLCIVFGFAFEWLFLVIGLLAGTPQAAQGMAFLVFPLTFVSSAYVPVTSMPGWLQAFAQHQPVTYMVGAVRALTLGPAAPSCSGTAPVISRPGLSSGPPGSYWSSPPLPFACTGVASLRRT